MKAPKIVVVGLVLVFALSFITGFIQATPGPTQEARKPEAKQPQREVLSKDISAIIQEGLATRKGRQEIPFTIFKSLYFWVQGGGMHVVVFFKAKNGDLGYALPVPPAPGAKNKPAVSPAPSANVLESRLAIALQFFQPDEKGNLKAVRETGFPVILQTDNAGYDPNKEEWYSFWYSLPYGKYAMALLIAPMDPKKPGPDLKKVGVSYYDIVLPGPEATQNSLDTTPLFFAKSIEQMANPEVRYTIHRGFFTYGVLRVVPNFENVITAEDKSQVELFFFLLGAKTKEEPAQVQALPTQQEAKPQQAKYDIEISYQVLKEDGTKALEWQPQTYPSFFIYQSLPLKHGIVIKDEKSNERREEKNLEPGKYSLVLKILDKVSQLKLEKKIPLEVK